MFQNLLPCLLIIQIVHTSYANFTFNNIEMCFVQPVQAKYEICRRYTINNINEINSEIPLFAITITNQSVPVLYEDSVADLTDIRGFIMKHNNLREIKPGAFRNLKEFIIGLAHNELEEIPEGVFTNLQGVEKLYLSNNRISIIHDKAFNNMTDLTFVCLNYNRLKLWNPDWLIGSPIISIAVTNNEIEELPAKAFKYVGYSQRQINRIIGINFSDNRLTALNRSITEDTARIQNFIVYNNPIIHIDDDFCQLIEMVYVDQISQTINCNITLYSDSGCKNDKTVPVHLCLPRAYARKNL